MSIVLCVAILLYHLEQSVEIPPTMEELVVTRIADNKLQYAGGSSALLSANVMTDTRFVVAPNTNPTDQSTFLRKGGSVGVLQSVPRIEVFNVSDADLSCEGYFESGQESYHQR